MHKIVEQGSGLAISQDNTVQKLMDSKAELKNELTHCKEQLVMLRSTKDIFEERAMRAESELEKEKMDNTKRKMELSNLAEEVRQKERQATHKETSVKKLEFDI